jgi:hypothetical protein
VSLAQGQAVDGLPPVKIPEILDGLREWKAGDDSITGSLSNAAFFQLRVYMDGRRKMFVDGRLFDSLPVKQQSFVLEAVGVGDRNALYRGLKKTNGRAISVNYFALAIKTESMVFKVPIGSLDLSTEEIVAMSGLQRLVSERMEAVWQRKEELAALADASAAARSLAASNDKLAASDKSKAQVDSRKRSTTGASATNSLRHFKMTIKVYSKGGNSRTFSEVFPGKNEFIARKLAYDKHHSDKNVTGVLIFNVSVLK